MIGTEYLTVLETLARKQDQIYPDACDYGIWETEENTTLIRDAMRGLSDLEGHKTTRWETGCACESRLGFEVDNGIVWGVTVKVTKHTDTRKRKAFFSIDIQRAGWKYGTAI